MSEIAVSGQSRFSRYFDELSRGFRAQSNVILALVFKDLRMDATRGRLGIAWAMMEPVVQISLMAQLWRPTGLSTINGVPIFLFMFAGVIPYLATRQSLTNVGLAMRRNDALFDYPQVKPFDAVIASYIYETTLLTISSIAFILLFGWFTGIKPPYSDPLGVMGIIGILVLFSLGLALMMGTYCSLHDDLAKMIGFVSRPLLFLSAIFFPMSQLPSSVRKVLAWNPLAQIIEHLRHYMLGMPLFPEASLEYTALSSFLIFGVGVIVYFANRFKLIQR
ncbi:Vi polysaccharide ABC transporter inner membrane protein VexB [soil metagenome]